MVLFVLQSPKTTLSTGIRRFFKELEIDKTMTQQSVSESKAKLRWEGIEYIFKNASVAELVTLNRNTWNEHFIYAIDGSKIALPMDKKLLDFFGAVGRGAKSPSAQGSILYDILNDIVIDAHIEPIKTDERALAMRHIDALETINPEDKRIVIFDRGYPSVELIKTLEERGLKYVMRVRNKFNLAIDAQTEDDGIVKLNEDGSPMELRVVKIKLDSGEIETLLTNIYECKLGVEDFKELYFLRWPIETKYNQLKNKLELENFSSRTVDGIKIDFYAAMYMTNFMASVEHDVKAKIEAQRQSKGNKYTYKTNKNELIGVLKDYFIVAIAHDCDRKRQEIIDKILKEAQQNVVPVRGGRKVARNPYPRSSKFHHNQKSNA